MSWRRSCPPPSLTTSFWIPITDPMIPNFLKFIFNWRIIALQCCVGFCHTTMSISYKYTHVPSLLNFSPTPYSIHLSRSSQSTGLISLCYTAASHQLAILHVIYIHMFQCYFQRFPFLSAPHCWMCSAKQTGRRMFGQWAPLLGRLKASQEDVARGWLVGPLNSYIFLYLKNPGSSEVHTNLRI